MKKIIWIFFVIVLLIFSCNKSVKEPETRTQRVFHTWNSLNEMEYRESVSHLILKEIISKQDFFPWVGIVSHHILAHDYIDAWFSFLARMRYVDTFFILSPDHYNVSLVPYSLTTGSWDSGFGMVESDFDRVLEIAKTLDVDLDHGAFIIEHGISSLMPYIKKYFPRAKTVSVIISGESQVNTYTMEFLSDALKKYFNKEGKQNNFLIVSSDFSHGGNPEETYKNDLQSEKYLNDSVNVSWNTVICDNRSGIYILDNLGKSNLISHILSHTNSFEISGVDEDITSYFFVYFEDGE